MGCQSTLNLNAVAPTGDFLNMDEAIFEPVTGTIVGVRGQWLMQFSATTGALIQSMRFAPNVGGRSFLVALGGQIFIGTTFTPSNNLNEFPGSTFPDRDIYIVDPTTFSTTGRMHMATLGVGSYPEFSFGSKQAAQYYSDGFRSLVAVGSKIIAFTDEDGILSFDPTNAAGTYERDSFSMVADVAYDSFNNVLWVPSQSGPNIWCLEPDLNSFNICHDTNNDLQSISGIAYNAAQNKVYCVKGAEDFYMVNAADAMPGFNNFPPHTVHTGRINATPYRIKSVNDMPGNPHADKVLIPCFADDSVITFDPLSDTVESVETGFVSPVDVIVCPTANFALQTGQNVLKKIT